jgi:hypothetical protein
MKTLTVEQLEEIAKEVEQETEMELIKNQPKEECKYENHMAKEIENYLNKETDDIEDIADITRKLLGKE